MTKTFLITKFEANSILPIPVPVTLSSLLLNETLPLSLCSNMVNFFAYRSYVLNSHYPSTTHPLVLPRYVTRHAKCNSLVSSHWVQKCYPKTSWEPAFVIFSLLTPLIAFLIDEFLPTNEINANSFFTFSYLLHQLCNRRHIDFLVLYSNIWNGCEFF